MRRLKEGLQLEQVSIYEPSLQHDSVAVAEPVQSIDIGPSSVVRERKSRHYSSINELHNGLLPSIRGSKTIERNLEASSAARWLVDSIELRTE